jgi:hypothetical protein
MKRRIDLIVRAVPALVAIVPVAGSLVYHTGVPWAHAAGDDRGGDRDGDMLLPVIHEHFNPVETHGLSDGGAPLSLGSVKTSPPPRRCNTAPSATADVNADRERDGATPHNETSTAVTPTNPLNLLGSVNDYQRRNQCA